MTATAASTRALSRLSVLRGRKRWDEQPTEPCAVLVATAGDPVSKEVVDQAVSLSRGEPVAVVTIARIYGSALGLPNPGLMPTRAEMDKQRELVTRTVGRLERAGVQAWGQVAATRRFAKSIAEVARARGVRHVLVVTPDTPRWRRVVEGDLAHDVAKRLPDDVVVDTVPP